MMDFNLFPNELLKMIVSYLNKRDARSLTLASKRMKDLALKRLWSKPTYDTPKDLDFSKKISKFPLEEMRADDFSFHRKHIVEILPKLKLLHINGERRQLLIRPKDITLLKVTLVLHTKILKLDTEEDFQDLLREIETGFIAKLIIDHANIKCFLSVEQLRKLVDKAYIPEICIQALALKDGKLEEYFEILSSMKYCKIHFPPVYDHDQLYKLSLEDVQLLIKYNVKIATISSSALTFTENPLPMVPALEQLKYMESFEYHLMEDVDSSILRYLTGLAITSINTSEFYFEEDDKSRLLSLIESLLRTKSFRCVNITENWWFHRFQPDELS